MNGVATASGGTTLPAGVSLTGSTLTVDPTNAAYNSLAVGQHDTITVSYTVTDGYTGGQTTNTETITINGTNDAPTSAANTVYAINSIALNPDYSINTTPEAPATHWKYEFQSTDFPFTDADNGDTLASVTVDLASMSTGLNGGFAVVSQSGTVTPILLTSGNVTINSAGTVSYNGNSYTNSTIVYVVPTTITGSNYAHFNFVVTDNNTGTSTSQTMTINVVGQNIAPVGVDDTASIAEDATTTTGNLLTNDTDGNAADSKTVTEIRTGSTEGSGTAGTVGNALTGTYGSLTANADGTYSYAINNALSAVQQLGVGQSLTDTFNYTVVDAGGLTDKAVLTVTINGTNDAPTFTSTTAQTVNGTEDTTYTVAISALVAGNTNDVDANTAGFGVAVTGVTGSIANYSVALMGDMQNIVTLAQWVSAFGGGNNPSATNAVLFNPADVFIYTPTANENGNVGSITYKLWDLTGSYSLPVADTTVGSAFSSATVTTTLNLAAVDDEATGTFGVTGTAQEGLTLTANLTGATDVDAAITGTTYQWQISANGSTGWSNIDGATSSTYDLLSDQSQVGQYVRAVATTTDAVGGTTDFISSAQQVANSNAKPVLVDTTQQLADVEEDAAGLPATSIADLIANSSITDIDGVVDAIAIVGGGSLTGPAKVTNNSVANSSVDAVEDAAGNVYSVYVENGNVVYKAFTAGAGWGTAVTLGAGSAPVISVGGGVVNVAYIAADNTVAFTSNSGSGWSAASNPISTMTSVVKVSIDTDAAGKAYVAAAGQTDGDGYRELVMVSNESGDFAQQWNADGWYWYENGGRTGRYYEDPVVSVDDAGNWSVVYKHQAVDGAMGWNESHHYLVFNAENTASSSIEIGTAAYSYSQGLNTTGAGAAQLVYELGGQIYFASLSNGAWTASASLGSGNNPSLSVDASGNTIIAYNCTLTSALAYRVLDNGDSGTNAANWSAAAPIVIDATSASNPVALANAGQFMYIANDGVDNEVYVTYQSSAPSNGVWQYSTDGGASWSLVGQVSDTSALLLGPTDLVRFVSAENFNGDVNFSFKAWDMATGTSGTYADTTAAGVAPDQAAFSTATGTATVTVTPVNDAPCFIALSANTVSENATVGTVVGNLVATDLEGDSITYSLVGTSNEFEVVGTQLRVKADAVINYEGFALDAPHTYEVTVRATDAIGAYSDQAFTIIVNDVNETPTDISLSASTVAENSANGTVIATLSATDVDADDTFTYSLVAGNGTNDADNGLVTIVGNELRVNGAIDFETNPTLAINVRVTDAGGLSYTKALTVDVTDGNDAPVISTNGGANVSANYAENATSVVADVDATDADGNTLTYSITGADVALFDINSGTGAVTWKAAPNYEAPADAGADNVYNFTVTATDNGLGNLTDAIDYAVTVTNVNEGPVATVPSTAYETDEDTAQFLTGLSVSDVDAGGANITVTLSVAHGVLSIATDVASGLTVGNITNNGSSTVTLTASVAAINATLANSTAVAYMPTADYNGSDTLTVNVNDNGNSGSGGAQTAAQQTVGITIAAVNDPATIGGDSAAAVSVAPSATDTGTLTVTDVDAGDAEFIAQTSQAATYGTYGITTGGVWTYVLGNNATVNKVPTGATITDSFTVSSKDGTDTQVVTVTITGTYAGVLTVAESEAVRGLTNFAINAATYDILDSSANLAATTNTIISKSGIGTVTASDAANATQAAAMAAFAKAVVYNVADSASALAATTGGISEAASVTVTGTTANAADLNTIDAATSGTVTGTSIMTVMGTVSAVKTTLVTNVTTTVLSGTETVTLNDAAATAVAAVDLASIGGATTGTVAATNALDISGTLSEAVAALVTANTKVVNQGTDTVTITDAATTAVTAANLAAVGGATTGTVTATNALEISGTTDELTAALVTAGTKVIATTSNATTSDEATIAELTAIDAAVATLSYATVADNSLNIVAANGTGLSAYVTGAVNVVLNTSATVAQMLAIDAATTGTLTYDLSDTVENIMAHPELAAGATSITFTADPNAPLTVAFSGTETMTASQVAIIDTGISANDLASVTAVSADVVLTHTNAHTLTVTGTTTLSGSELIFEDGSLVKLGGTGADTMYGSNIAAAGDFLAGAGGNDIIRGLAGADTIYGGDGADIIYGGAGADNIVGGVGNDLMYGGNSSTDDTAVDTFNYIFDVNEGSDLIVGFNNAQDKINLHGQTDLTNVTITNGASNTVIVIHGTDPMGANDTTITLVGVTTGIDVNDFTFN